MLRATAIRLLLLLLALRLALLCRLVHGVQDAEIMLRMLEIAFRLHPVPAAGRVAAELEILLEQLLRGAAQPDIRTIAVEHMVPIQRNTATGVVADITAAATTTAATASTTAT